MAVDVRVLMGNLFHYVRGGYWAHVAGVCDRALSERGEDPVFRLWRGVALDRQGQSPQALNELAQCGVRSEVNLARLHATVRAHKRCKLIETDSLRKAEEKLAAEQAVATESAKLQSAAYLFAVGEPDLANKLLSEPAIAEADDAYICARTLRGWALLADSLETAPSKALSLFDAALALPGGTTRHIDALCGRAEALRRKGDVPAAVEAANTAIAELPNYWPALLIKSHAHLQVQEWDGAVEAAGEAKSKDKSGAIEAEMVLLLSTMAREGRAGAPIKEVNELFRTIESTEPANPPLYLLAARTVARLCGRNTDILAQCERLVEKAHALLPAAADYQCELGYIAALQGRWADAQQWYTKANKADEGSVVALAGLTRTGMALGQTEDAERSLEFLREVQLSTGRTALFGLLAALAAKARGAAANVVLDRLDEAVAQFVTDAEKGAPSWLYFQTRFDAALLSEIIREYTSFCPSQPPEPTDAPAPAVAKAIAALNVLLKWAPGIVEGQVLYARLMFVDGRRDVATYTLQKCLAADGGVADAHLLAAHIALASENPQAADAALEQVLSLEFGAKDWVEYTWARGRTQLALNEVDDAIRTLEHGVAMAANPSPAAASRRPAVFDVGGVHCELVAAHLRNGAVDLAQQAADAALAALKGTPEHGRVMCAQATVALRRDPEASVGVLKDVPSSSPYYLKARAQMANVYLIHLASRRNFCRTYEEVAAALPDVASAQRYLGTAYLAVNEADRAVVALRRAATLAPTDPVVQQALGAALAATHQYSEAVDFYRGAVEADASRVTLRLDLGELLLRLGQHDKSIQVLKEAVAVKRHAGEEQGSALSDRVRAHLVLAKAHAARQDDKPALDSLTQARVFQTTLLGHMRHEPPSAVVRQRRVLASICCEIGAHHTASGAVEKALLLYNEALKHDETCDVAMLAVARLHVQRDDFEAAETQCMQLLRSDAEHHEAMLILADVLFRRQRFDEACEQFSRVLAAAPTNITALVLYVQLLRRAGRLKEAPAALEATEKAVGKARHDPGMRFARGLYHQYSGNSTAALREFNFGRFPRDAMWSSRCVEHMIQVYTAPDNELPWDAAGTPPPGTDPLAEATKLLGEVSDPRRRAILHGYILMASRQKDNIEKALTKFFEMSQSMDKAGGGTLIAGTSEKVDVPALVGMAVALHLLKQTPRAKNNIKKAIRVTNPSPAEADDVEKALLLGAAIAVETAKYDIATEALKRAIGSNRSCGRGWELLGLVYEKEHSYRDAADCYEHVWRLSGESDPGVGFKLAFNYLKAKRFVSAIDICHKILEQYPSYPKVRREILDKARSSLRPG